MVFNDQLKKYGFHLIKLKVGFFEYSIPLWLKKELSDQTQDLAVQEKTKNIAN